MSNDIRIKKGLDIKLIGEAEKTVEQAVISNYCTVRPEDFHSVVPKLVAKEGAVVKAGETLFYDKSNEVITFSSPVSGKVLEVIRGPKRRIDAIKIEADKTQSYKDYGVFNLDNATAESVKAHFLNSGCWPFIKQRPYDVIANPNKSPKAIFISGYASAPLAANLDFTLKGKEAELQAAITALGKLTEGVVNVSVASNSSPLAGLNGITLHHVSGPHPSGNVGTLINKVNPVNKGEVVWTVNAQDLVIIGELLLTGKFNAERVIALVGSSVEKPRYFKTKIGSEVSTIVYDKGIKKGGLHDRIISGNVLSGKEVEPDGALDYYSNVISVIPEGDDYEFFGWNKPVFNKLSVSRALTFSWLNPNKKYDLNTNTNGEHRAFVTTGTYEEVFPLDIYPMQILKACMYQDLDEMEALGMYEVAPEDFALTEFVCVSKQPHQKIIRAGLDLMLKEIG
ncbi:MAG: Na(+)-translocating NADH-quinone reductase subunit A [Flaviramulus sp.]|nr:Na(+)-translocating NADH-quinone reductase subunit A [Flaviramulus sp.]NNC49750.1 Na(+)-translocating NADH-quinone reductase subunit A [Flaviramulus sp.]